MEDLRWSYLELSFACNADKYAANPRKHGVDLMIASTAFGDPCGITFGDLTHSEDEERDVLIGNSNTDVLLFIVYTLRGQTIRLISARKCKAHEVKIYAEQ